jgi:hypothetical protein
VENRQRDYPRHGRREGSKLSGLIVG